MAEGLTVATAATAGEGAGQVASVAWVVMGVTTAVVETWAAVAVAYLAAKVVKVEGQEAVRAQWHWMLLHCSR